MVIKFATGKRNAGRFPPCEQADDPAPLFRCVSDMTGLVLDCPPLYGTLRDPSRETLGAGLASVAEQLGVPFMPWQRRAA